MCEPHPLSVSLFGLFSLRCSLSVMLQVLVRLARRLFNYSSADLSLDGAPDASVAMAMVLLEHLHYRHAEVAQGIHK